MVGQRVLVPSIRVRILVPEPCVVYYNSLILNHSLNKFGVFHFLNFLILDYELLKEERNKMFPEGSICGLEYLYHSKRMASFFLFIKKTPFEAQP